MLVDEFDVIEFCRESGMNMADQDRFGLTRADSWEVFVESLDDDLGRMVTNRECRNAFREGWECA
jgi:hypothetical protein